MQKSILFNLLKFNLLVLFCLILSQQIFGQSSTRTFSGVIVTQQFELVPNVNIEIETSGEKIAAKSDKEGAFSVKVPDEPISVRFFGNNIEPFTRIFAPNEKLENTQIKVIFVVPPVSEKVMIEDNALSPEIETRNDSVFNNTLFGRDDQLIQTLNAGINAGQHEGGGKSLEIRRFGFNTDHGGVNGGLKILVDNVQQNQGTQGHGQGYLGNLKSLSPELVARCFDHQRTFFSGLRRFFGFGRGENKFERIACRIN